MATRFQIWTPFYQIAMHLPQYSRFRSWTSVLEYGHPFVKYLHIYHILTQGCPYTIAVPLFLSIMVPYPCLNMNIKNITQSTIYFKLLLNAVVNIIQTLNHILRPSKNHPLGKLYWYMTIRPQYFALFLTIMVPYPCLYMNIKNITQSTIS